MSFGNSYHSCFSQSTMFLRCQSWCRVIFLVFVFDEVEVLFSLLHFSQRWVLLTVRVVVSTTRWAVEQWHRMGCRVEFVDLTLGVGECRVSPVRFEEPACLPPSASWPCIACRHMLNHLGLGHCQGRSWAQLWFKRASVFGILLVSLPWIPAKSFSSYLVGCKSIGLLSLLLLLLFRSL